MKFKTILTNRSYQKWPSWHIIHEWEDELAKSLDLSLKDMPLKDNFVRKNFRRIDAKFFNGRLEMNFYSAYNFHSKKSLYFEINTQKYRGYFNKKSTIPIIIDFWDKKNIEKVKKNYAVSPYLFITSLEVIDFFKQNNFQNKLIHFPMSLPSIYSLKPDRSFIKKYDIIIAGRKNPKLWEYLKRYEIKFPNIEYIYQVQQNKELYYTSNKKGIIGKYHERFEYMKLIESSKVGFYSTPGIDGGELRTNGFNPVTPRLFELLAGGCHIISRHPKNIETDYYKLDSICPSIISYEHFEKELNDALHSAQPIKKNADYLIDYYTAKNVEIFKNLE
jgi:hypothetical protein